MASCARPHATESRVDLWTIALDGEPDHDDLRLLSADELRRAQSIILPPVRRRFVRARAGLRRILAQATGAAAQDLEFHYGPHGKPALALAAAPQFNLSHSGELAVLAVVAQGALGVDLEACRGRANPVALARRFFSCAEAAAVDAAGERGRERCFLRCWTRREAVLKASGRGIGVDLQALEVGVAAAPLHLRLPGDGRDLHVQDLDLGADWIGALCVALPDGAGQPPRVHMAGHLAARTRSRTGIAA